MSLAYNFMTDDGEKPVRREQFGTVIDAFDRFGDRGVVLRELEAADESVAKSFAETKPERWKQIFIAAEAAEPFLPDAGFLPAVDQMLAASDIALQRRRREIEIGVNMIEGLVSDLASDRLPAEILRRALMITMKQRVREHDDLVEQYYTLQAMR